MSWLQTGEELLRSLLVLFGPGVLLGAALGLRRWWLVAAAPALSVGVLGGWAVVLAEAGIAWVPLSAGAASVVTAALVAAVPRPRRRRPGHADPAEQRDRGDLGSWLFTVVGLVGAAVLAAPTVARGTSTPDTPPQTWDGVFHLNAVRHVLETHDASSLHLGSLTTPMRETSIYPGGWHAVTSLVVGDSIPVAANMVAVVVAALVFPLGCALLASALVPASPYLPGLAALASVPFVAFPSRMLSYGTLWPNALAFAILPVAVALTARLVYPVIGRGRSTTTASPRRTGPLLLVLLVALAGLTVAHPNALASFVVITGVLGVVVLVRGLVAAVRGRSVTRLVVLLLGILALAALVALALRSPQMQSAMSYERPTYATAGDAVLQALTDSQLASMGAGNVEQSWALAVLTAVGLVAALVRRPTRWLVVAYAAVLLLHVAANDPTLPVGPLAGPWYSDAVRLGGLVVIVAVPLVALGLHVVVDAALGLLRVLRRSGTGTGTARQRGARVVAATVAVAAGGAFVVATDITRADLRELRVRAEYGRSDDPAWEGIVTGREIALLSGLDELVPEDSLILGSPFTGAALAYALGGVDVVFPHMRGSWSPDARYLGKHLAEIATDPEVCAAIDRLGVTHVYVDPQVYWPTHAAQSLYTGIPSQVPAPEGFTLVARAERAELHAVDMC